MQNINYTLFTISAFILVITPGPDVIYITVRGISQGKSAALISMLGVCSGYIVHTLLAVFGLSALLRTSQLLFDLLRSAGALYLIYLGARTLWRRDTIHFTAVNNAMPPAQLFRTGLLTSVLNPKSTLFFLAFLPQFVVPNAGQVPLQMFTLGAIWTLLCVFAYTVIAFSTGTFGNRLAATPKFGSIMRWVSGSVFVALGLRLLIPDKR